MSQLPVKLPSNLPTDQWLNSTWEEYIQVSEEVAHEHARGYYHNGHMRLEMSPLGNPHSRDHFIILVAIALYASSRGIDLDGHDNCTYRKTGEMEAQPDASFYIGTNADVVSWDTTIIDLDTYPAPDLVVEVASSSLTDDKGEKRMLYEALGVREYWIIDVQNVEVIAFAIANRGSRRIEQSQVLPNLDMAVLTEALQRSRHMNHSKVSTWLLSQFQKLEF